MTDTIIIGRSRYPRKRSARETFCGTSGLREELAQFLCERVHCLIDNLRLGEALQASSLAGQLALEDPGVRGDWSIATVMAHALERARKKAGMEGHEGLDLRWVYVPDGKLPFERWAAPIVRDGLKRIARIRERTPADNCDRAVGAPGRAGGTILVSANFQGE